MFWCCYWCKAVNFSCTFTCTNNRFVRFFDALFVFSTLCSFCCAICSFFRPQRVFMLVNCVECGTTRTRPVRVADRGIIARYRQGEATPAGFGRQSGTWHSQGRTNGATPTTSCQNSSSGSTGWYWNELIYLINLSFFGITKNFLTSWFFYFLSLMFSFLLDM